MNTESAEATAIDFAALGAHPLLMKAIAAHGYTEPTPVQAAVLAEALRGRDLLVSSRTGSGKTVAFGLAFATQLLPVSGEGAVTLPRTDQPLALVIAPTRELALQVATELGWLYAPAGARVATCVGGREISREVRSLREGPHIVVGTPGRLVDHLERRSLRLEKLRALVLDEADEMLDMGFRDELERILRDAPAERRTLLFSATIPRAIEELARKYQRDAARVAATPPQQANQDIEVRAHLIAMREREHAVVNLLRFYDAPSTIVFCATRDGVSHLHASLAERGFTAVALSGELTQPERTRALQALRDGRARVLVATDVAARGLDLPDVALIIQADLPHDAQVMQHRSGRTGRAGRKGVSVLLVPSSSRRTAERLFTQGRIKAIWAPLPSAEQIHVLDGERLLTGLSALVEEVSAEDREVAQKLIAARGAEELVAALVRSRREALPAPEELPLSADVFADSQRPGPSRKIATHPTARGSYPDSRPLPGARGSDVDPRTRSTERPYSASKAHAADKAPPASRTARPDSREHAGSRTHAATRTHYDARTHSSGARDYPASRSPLAPRASGAAHAPLPVHPARAAQAAKASAAATADSPAAAEVRKASAVAAPQKKTAGAGPGSGPALWFRVNVGRSRNADPRWLLPLLCRRGGVGKSEIGKIEIMADETRFEVVRHAATGFEKAARLPDEKDPQIKIGPAPAPAGRSR